MEIPKQINCNLNSLQIPSPDQQSSPHDAQDTHFTHLCFTRPEDLVQISYACFKVKVTVTEYNLSMVEVYTYCSLKSSLLTISG